MKSKTQTGTGARERTFEGLPVGAGVAIGVVYRHDSRSVVQVRERKIPAAKVRTEQHRVLEAAHDAGGRMQALQQQAKRMSNQHIRNIMHAHCKARQGHDRRIQQHQYGKPWRPQHITQPQQQGSAGGMPGRK